MAASPGGEKETTDPYGCRFLLSPHVPRTPETRRKFFSRQAVAAVLAPLSQVEPTNLGIERGATGGPTQKRRTRLLGSRSLVVVQLPRRKVGFQPRATLFKAKSPGRSQGPNTGLLLASTGHALHVTPACMSSPPLNAAAGPLLSPFQLLGSGIATRRATARVGPGPGAHCRHRVRAPQRDAVLTTAWAGRQAAPRAPLQHSSRAVPHTQRHRRSAPHIATVETLHRMAATAATHPRHLLHVVLRAGNDVLSNIRVGHALHAYRVVALM